MVKHTETDGSSYQAISIPTILFPGLIHALHRKLNHPSKAQLSKLAARYFYSPGYLRIVEEVTNGCDLCATIKQLPKALLSESTGTIEGFGTNFSADVNPRLNNFRIEVIFK